jgi:hypothetical protein
MSILSALKADNRVDRGEPCEPVHARILPQDFDRYDASDAP